VTMTEAPTGTLLVVSGDCSDEVRAQCGKLVGALSTRLGQMVALCLREDPGEPVVAGIRPLVASGAQRLVIVPLLLSPKQEQGEIPLAIKWASRRWPFLTFHAATPLNWQEWGTWLNELALDCLTARTAQAGPTAVVLAGNACSDSLANANLARLAHLVRSRGIVKFARVDYSFLDIERPGISETLQMQARLGMRNIVVVPWLLHASEALRRLEDQVEQTAQDCDLNATVAATPLSHSTLIDSLISHHQEALADDSFLAPSWTEIQAEIARNLGPAAHAPNAITAEEEVQLRELDRKIKEILPPEYEGRYEEVSPQPMGAAPLKFGSDGKVAWDEMWQSFCDLALAGGPPHRGTLLEAVPAADALAEPQKYQAIVEEIERGLQLVTGLPVVRSKTLGWVGIRCDSEDMAIWLMRAIIVENVMVRREDDVIYLPAGPRFTLKREIKNVVTVIAKTTHYWTAHIVAKRRGVKRPSVASTAATPA
jgi:sirohydrochlorin cobaltochelatase